MTPTPEQIAKVAIHVGLHAWIDQRLPDTVFVRNRRWCPLTGPADCMDLQRRVRAMGYDVTLSSEYGKCWCKLASNCYGQHEEGQALAVGSGPDDAHALFWAVWQLVEAGSDVLGEPAGQVSGEDGGR